MSSYRTTSSLGISLPRRLIVMISHPLDDAFAKEALRPDQQEKQGQHVSEPVLDAAAEHRPPNDSSDQCDQSRDRPDDDPAVAQRDADRLSRLVVVRDGAQCPAD